METVSQTHPDTKLHPNYEDSIMTQHPREREREDGEKRREREKAEGENPIHKSLSRRLIPQRTPNHTLFSQMKTNTHSLDSSPHMCSHMANGCAAVTCN